ncbi:MAG: IclR-like transcriptional regulator [Chloroflexi bacterium]|nr:IclR-like transcriptional regulator [Chloroflexota bacterium]
MERPSWGLLSDHALVLLAIADQPDLRARDIAAEVGLTPEVAERLIADLMVEGYVVCRRIGRRTVYNVHGEAHLNHGIWPRRQLSALLELLSPRPDPEGHPT